MGLLVFLFFVIVVILITVALFSFIGILAEIGEKIDKKVGIKKFGMFSLVVIVFFIIPFMVTVPLWSSGFFKNAFGPGDQWEGLLLILIPAWVAFGLLVVTGMAIGLWQRTREKREREQKEQIPVQKSTTSGTATTTNWFYYNENGEKIAVTVGQIRELARQGTIVPETVLETPEGRTAPARKAKGLTFAEPPVP